MKSDEDKLRAYFKDKGDPVCPLCQHREWGVSGKIFYLGEFDKGGVDFSGARFPVIPMTCTNCGYTAFISALVSGILEKGNGGK